MSTSWKTTVFGVLAGVGAGITGAYLIKPEILAPFPAWLPGLGVLLSSISTACLGMAARDNNKTSEQVGAGPGSGSPVAVRTLVAALLVASLAPLALEGCASANKAAYTGVSATDISVQTAMGIWNAYVGAKHPGPDKEMAVKRAYDAYQASMLLVCDAGAAYSASGGTNAAAALQYAVSHANQSFADLANTLTTFGVKLK